MEEFDIVIIGVGVVGLAIARHLSNSSHRRIIVLERHATFGEETSSRNSEVIHAGMYYPQDSLKASLCVRGNDLIYDFCRRYNIPHRACGKLIVGNTDEELQNVNELYEQGQLNGVPGLELIEKDRITQLEPLVNARLALFSSTTGLVDVHQLMRVCEIQAANNDVLFAYRNRVTALERLNNGYKIEVLGEDGDSLELFSPIVINAAGLEADKIAALAGIDVDQAGYRQHFCKGEYFNVANRHAGKISHLVYPTPTDISLGIHTRLRLDGTLALGPNAFYIDKIDYTVDESHKLDFWHSVRDFLPFITMEDLTPDMAGIRPKLQAAGEDFRDFVIQEESRRDLPGLINLVGIDSPGLTAALAIAEYVSAMIKAYCS
jgi:L-2-hydroxyglutarate oxidase LhgO